jgi:hypothetical protein
MAKADRNRKLLVRAALVTSSTIATLVGAQNLALLDTRQIESEPLVVVEPTETAPAPPLPTSTPPVVEIVHAAPSVTILRRAGESGPIQPPAAQSSVIQPPPPVQVAQPAPVIVQGEAPPPVIIQQASASSGGSRTRSSR